MVRTISVRSRQDMEKLAGELRDYTIVFTTDDSFIALKDGKIAKRFKVQTRGRQRSVETQDALAHGGHILMLYDDTGYSKKILTDFIRSRLERGENCVYATPGDPQAIESMMREIGIDVDSYLRKGILHLYRLVDASAHPTDRIRSALRDELVKVLAEPSPSTRIFFRMVPEIDTKLRRSIVLELERGVQMALHGRISDSAYDPLNGFKGSFICPFKIGGKIGPELWEWLVSALANHDSAVLIARNRITALTIP